MKRGSMQKFLRRTQEVLQELWPCSIEINGEEFDGACTGKRGVESVEAGGAEEEFSITVRVDKSVMPNRPKVGDEADVVCENLEIQHEVGRIRQVTGDQEPAWMIRIQSDFE